jgi:hypothetical protein
MKTIQGHTWFPIEYDKNPIHFRLASSAIDVANAMNKLSDLGMIHYIEVLRRVSRMAIRF